MERHFSLKDGLIVALTPCGVATARLLKLNCPPEWRYGRLLLIEVVILRSRLAFELQKMSIEGLPCSS